jgi:hypothetical protein
MRTRVPALGGATPMPRPLLPVRIRRPPGSRLRDKARQGGFPLQENPRWRRLPPFPRAMNDLVGPRIRAGALTRGTASGR